MTSSFNKVLSFILVLTIILSGLPVTVYGQEDWNTRNYKNDTNSDKAPDLISLGNSAIHNNLVQTEVSSLSSSDGAVQVKAGSGNFSVMLKNNGTVWTWGSNSGGELGDGTTVDKAIAVKVSGLIGAISVASGESHSVALKLDGTVWAWGYNGYGQMGDNTTANKITPVRVGSLTNVIDIAAGDHHGLALKSDGTVWAWGYNSNCQLGDGSKTNQLTPIQVGITDVVSIDAGGS